ncbi:hypothetical protein PGT21_026646 [Puccinia graminis f. sp. tritici]|uniref:Uncharacterized protein n=1 Tax=Puccinia graminis f. sp. tritici TaxID=56615 RepID=A0A5B0NEU4_PUCGR|nr:hypothetical protein PGT21_026646 [Puccinia graminis f. sp. tritici]
MFIRSCIEHKVCESTAKRQAYDKEDDVNDVMSLDSDDRQSWSSRIITSSNKRSSSTTLIDRISSPSIELNSILSNESSIHTHPKKS